MYKVEFYKRPNGKEPVEEWLGNTLDDKQIPVIMAKMDCLSREGLKLLSTNMLEKIENEPDLYELKGGQCRVLIFHDKQNNKFVMLYGFLKKKQRETRHIDEGRRMLREYFSNK